MLSSTMKYAKLAWVYAKGICSFRRKVYDLKFVYVPEDKLWYTQCIYLKQPKDCR